MGLTLGGTTAGQITETGTGPNTISITGYYPGLTFTNNYTLNPGNNGTVNLIAGSGTITAGSGSTPNTVTVTSSAGSATLNINTGHIAFVAGSTFTDNNASGTAINLNTPLGGSLTITGPTGYTGTISATGGGNLLINPQFPYIGALTFAQSGSGSATVELDAGSGVVTVNSNSYHRNQPRRHR